MLSWCSKLKLSQFVCWLAALCIFLIVTHQSNAYSYSYDARISVSNLVNVRFESQSQHYDDTPNLCYRCINPSVENLQEKAIEGPFLAFEVGFVASKGLRGLQSKFDDLAETHLLPLFRKLDPNLTFGFTGSFRTGVVGNPSKARFGQSGSEKQRLISVLV